MLWGEAAERPHVWEEWKSPGHSQVCQQCPAPAALCRSLSLVFGELRLPRVWVEMSRG